MPEPFHSCEFFKPFRKEITGKTTSQQITGRIIQEANALLKHTDWNIAEIAYGLGFEEPSYFTNYFKSKPE
jgi:AraC-like DNA-binding protein